MEVEKRYDDPAGCRGGGYHNSYVMLYKSRAWMPDGSSRMVYGGNQGNRGWSSWIPPVQPHVAGRRVIRRRVRKSLTQGSGGPDLLLSNHKDRLFFLSVKRCLQAAGADYCYEYGVEKDVL